MGCPLSEGVHRIVLDTCVIVTAFRSRNGASRVVLDWVADRLLVPLLTPALFLQYEDVLKRPEQLRISRLTLTQVDQILAALGSAAEPVAIHYSWRPQLPDPTDESGHEVQTTATRSRRHGERDGIEEHLRRSHSREGVDSA